MSCEYSNYRKDKLDAHVKAHHHGAVVWDYGKH